MPRQCGVRPAVRLGREHGGGTMHAVGLAARRRIGIFAAVCQLERIPQAFSNLRLPVDEIAAALGRHRRFLVAPPATRSPTRPSVDNGAQTRQRTLPSALLQYSLRGVWKSPLHSFPLFALPGVSRNLTARMFAGAFLLVERYSKYRPTPWAGQDSLGVGLLPWEYNSSRQSGLGKDRICTLWGQQSHFA